MSDTDDFSVVYNQLQYAMDEFKQELSEFPSYDPENVIELKKIAEILKQHKNYSLSKRINAQPMPTYTKYRTQEYQVENPEKSGFFGFFKFWEPSYLTKTREVPDGEYIKYGIFSAAITNASRKELEEMEDGINSAMATLYEDQGNACLEIVFHLNAAMDRVSTEIEQAILEANSITNNKSKILKMQGELSKTREMIACIQDMDEQGEEI